MLNLIIIIIIIGMRKQKVVSVTIGENGTISKSFRLYLSNIQVKHEIKNLKKTATLGSAHILRKTIM
jgi:rRNA maturation protein Rpf1